MLVNFVSLATLAETARKWVFDFGKPTEAEIDVRVKILADGSTKVTYYGEVGSGAWPDVSAVATSMQGLEAQMCALITHERNYHEQELADLKRRAAALGMVVLSQAKPSVSGVAVLEGGE